MAENQPGTSQIPDPPSMSSSGNLLRDFQVLETQMMNQMFQFQRMAQEIRNMAQEIRNTSAVEKSNVQVLHQEADRRNRGGVGCRNFAIPAPNIQARRNGPVRTTEDATEAGRERDAPGQSCVHISPGDHREEFYRLATFGKFPVAVPVRVTELASVGFYYTGFKDRVKCFSCGMAVENWIVNDDGMDPKWHRTDCPLMLGDNSQNSAQATPNFHTLFRRFRGLKVRNYIAEAGTAPGNSESFGNSRSPSVDVTDRLSRVRVSEPTYPKLTFGNILSQAHEDYLKQINLRSEAERRETFAKWPSYPAPYSVSELAKDGFFYLGNLDRAQCFSCSGILRNWVPRDNVREQHGKHFSNCLMVRNMDTGNIPMTDAERQRADREYQEKMDRKNSSHGEPPNPPGEEQRHLAQQFPCRNPVNPHMLSLQRRVETFDQRWPKTRMQPSGEQIAKAGFFFLGEGDKTICFYCNGGLQNWEPNDEPWTEHAKWFPGCEFILSQKGVHFVRRLVEAHPNLNRPYILNAADYGNVTELQSRAVPCECLANDIDNGRCFLGENAQFADRVLTTAVSIVAEEESNNVQSNELEQQLQEDIERSVSCQSASANARSSSIGKPPRGC